MTPSEMKKVLEAGTSGPLRVEASSRNGAEVWVHHRPTGSMMLAKCGHASFDYENARKIVACVNAMPLLVELWVEVEKFMPFVEGPLADSTRAQEVRKVLAALAAHKLEDGT